MVFQRKGSFFLDLSEGESKPAVQVAPVAEARTAPAAPPAAAKAAPTTAASTAAASAAAAPAAAAAPVLTTAEAIAAELAAAQASRPAPSQATFAPECLNPANAVPTRRRRAGANLAGFKAMAASLIRS
jgi:hypothetical protein